MTQPYDLASSMLGKHEATDSAAISDYLATGGANLDPVTRAWCAAYVNSTLEQSGISGTGKMNARSFMDWGQPVDTPQKGDVAVFSRGDPKGWQGHVGFFDSLNPDGTINVLGGNQGDRVSVSPYSADRLLGYRRAAQPDPATGVNTGFGPTAENAANLPAPAPEQQTSSPIGAVLAGMAPDPQARPQQPQTPALMNTKPTIDLAGLLRRSNIGAPDAAATRTF